MIRLRTLGALDLNDDGGRRLDHVLAQPKRLALLVYLSVASPRGAHRRDHLLSLFWPELDTPRSRDALNQALRFLRQTLGAAVFTRRGGDDVGIADDQLWCDAVAFREALRRGSAAGAMALYEGDFLSAFHVEACRELQEWMAAERDSLRREAGEAAWQVAADHGARGNWLAAVASARRAVALGPDDEPGIRRLLELHRRAGDRAGALHAYAEFARRLRAEYGCEPSVETTALVRELTDDERVSDPAGRLPHDMAPTTAAGFSHTHVPDDATLPRGARLPRRPTHRTRVAYGATGVVVVSAVTLAVIASRGSPSFTAYVPGRTIPLAVTSATEYQPAISPDGKVVAFAAATPDGFRIFVRQVNGGRSVLLTGNLPGTHLAPKWSPDQTRILFEVADGASPVTAYVVPALGGTPRRIVDSPVSGIATPAWSPSAAEIAYADDRGIWVQPLDGGARRLVVEGAAVHSPAWSPDATHLAFVEGVPQTLDNVSTTTIKVVSVNGGAAVSTSDGASATSSPAWAPDGRSLFFVSNAGGVADIYQQPIEYDGRPAGPPERLTVGLSPLTISMSANGTHLAHDAVRRQSSIWMAIAGQTTTDAVQITKEKETIECLSLSHDGAWLAYDSNRNGTFDIYKLHLFDGEPVQLTSSRANEFCPAWSPDDRQIAFHSARRGPRDIFVVNAETGVESTAVADSLEKFEPWWSPDGQRLSYYVLRLRGEFAGGSIMVVDRRSQGGWSPPRALAMGLELGPAALPQSPHTDDLLVGGTSLQLVSARDGSARPLVDSASLNGAANWPKWSPDGSTVYYHFERPTGAGFVSGLSSRPADSVTTGFMAVPVTGGVPRMIVREDPKRRVFRGQFATDGRRFFFTAPSVDADVYVLELGRR